MAVRFDPHHPRAGVLRILLCFGLLVLGSQCSHLTKFAPRSKERPAKRSPSTHAEQAEEDEAQDDSEDAANHRLITRDDTPFFRWLRTGLEEGATPSRYLEADTKVELLEESDEKTFSRVRLETKEKGWVPSRLLAPMPASLVGAGADTPSFGDPSPEISEPSGTADPAAPPLDEESPDPGPIDPLAIPEIHIPEVGVDVQSDG